MILLSHGPEPCASAVPPHPHDKSDYTLTFCNYQAFCPIFIIKMHRNSYSEFIAEFYNQKIPALASGDLLVFQQEVTLKLL